MLMRFRRITAVVVAIIAFTVSAHASDSAKKNDNPIKIGVYLPLTGPYAFGGELELSGVRLAHKKIPEILNRKVELIVADTKSDKVEAANVVMRLASSDKVSAIIGTYGSSLAMAGSEVAEKAKVPTITASATSPLITQGKKYYFRASFVDPYQAESGALYAAKILRAKKVAILKDVSSDYGVGLANYFAKAFKKLGGEVVLNLSYNSGDQDFSAALIQIMAQKPDLLYITSYFAEGAIILKQARELGIKFRIMGGDAMDNPETVAIAGKDAEGFMHTTLAFDEDNPNMPEATRQFVEEWRKTYPDKRTNVNAVLAYIAYLIVMKSIENAGTDDREAITREMTRLKDFETPFGVVSMDENHNPHMPVGVIEIKNGKRVLLEVIAPDF